MHPAPSVIVFTVLSGMGFGLLAALAVLGGGAGLPALLLWGLAYGLTGAGLLSSTLHLARPDRAWRALSQWRSSWLSREGIGAIATLIVLAPQALDDAFGLWGLHLRLLGWVGSVLALATVFCTAMIYAQLKSVPRWNDGWVVVGFLAFAGVGGAIWRAPAPVAALAALVLMGVMAVGWWRGDRAFAARGGTLAGATGLTGLAQAGRMSVFAPAHTGGNYLMREMIFVVGRKHARRLRGLALLLAGVGPALVLLALPDDLARPVAALIHLVGAAAQRWLFFAEAEHVVGLYYGARGR